MVDQKKVVGLVIIGGGPAGMGIPLRAARAGQLQDLLKKGCFVIERGTVCS